MHKLINITSGPALHHRHPGDLILAVIGDLLPQVVVIVPLVEVAHPLRLVVDVGIIPHVRMIVESVITIGVTEIVLEARTIAIVK